MLRFTKYLVPRMNFRSLFGSFLALALTPVGVQGGIFSKDKSLPKELAVRTTAYTHTEADHIQYGRKSAAGTKLQYGRGYSSAAADWSKFPLGTKFKIDGMPQTFVIDDYGSALVGTETIDIYKPSRSAMNQWGVRHVDIKILEYGDFEKSREILEGRTKYSHVRQMLAGMKKDPGPEPQKSKNAPVEPKSPALPAPPLPAAPEIQLAAKSNPAPVPAPPIPAPASAPSVKKPEPLPSPAPQLVVSAPKAAPAPATPESEPKAPTRTFRKVQPLQIASIAPTESEPAAVSHLSSETPAAAQAAPNAPRKREFRPLVVSANG